VRATVLDDAIQGAPAFRFDSAHDARAFGNWIDQHFDEINEQAESSTRTGLLRHIEPYSASKYRFLHFNFASGDGAGQNMSRRATAAACEWIARNYDGIRYFQLEANLAPTRPPRRSTSSTRAASGW
jgi:hydroxymethylglutaryl-CoA reductase (NADPH)